MAEEIGPVVWGAPGKLPTALYQHRCGHVDCWPYPAGPDGGGCEWREWTGRAFHLRRRLSVREQREVGPVVDIRGSDEARRRAERLGPLLVHVPPEVLAEELGAT